MTVQAVNTQHCWIIVWQMNAGDCWTLHVNQEPPQLLIHHVKHSNIQQLFVHVWMKTSVKYLDVYMFTLQQKTEHIVNKVSKINFTIKPAHRSSVFGKLTNYISHQPLRRLTTPKL